MKAFWKIVSINLVKHFEFMKLKYENCILNFIQKQVSVALTETASF